MGLFVFYLLLFSSSVGVAFAETEKGKGSVQGTINANIVFKNYTKEMMKQAKNLESLKEETGNASADFFTVSATNKGSKIKEKDLVYYRGLGGLLVTVGQYATTTDADGKFNLLEIPVGHYEYSIVLADKIIDSGTIKIKSNETSTIDFDLSVSAEQAAINMGINDEDAFEDVITQHHTHGGAPHCNKSGSGPAFPLTKLADG